MHIKFYGEANVCFSSHGNQLYAIFGFACSLLCDNYEKTAVDSDVK